MLFNSFAFAVFLPLVFALYWALQGRSLRLQNLLLLAASYVFYGWWDIRFLALLIASSLVDFTIGLLLQNSAGSRRKRILAVSLCFNLGVLCIFKYFNFFVESFSRLLASIGWQPDMFLLQIVLPVGISFYTFQSLSYTIDVYRNKIKATRDPIEFLTFVAFFPQLVAGPIERATDLLPQFQTRRSFDAQSAKDGLRRMLWGFFKKLVIADTLSAHVETIYSGYAGLDGSILALGTFYFAIQIYCDFSGYSDIAIGTARLFGFRLSQNFSFPYFSRNIAEFWRRWHISLSSWFRDYVYISLGGGRVPLARRIANILITFTLSGFWHGANWTFICWGLLNGLYYVPVVILGRDKRQNGIVADGRLLPAFVDLASMSATFLLTLLGWIFFRSASVGGALDFIERMFSAGLFTMPAMHRRPLPFIALLLLVEWLQRSREHGLQIAHLPQALRWLCYYALIVAILFFGNFGHVAFIYFQF